MIVHPHALPDVTGFDRRTRLPFDHGRNHCRSARLFDSSAVGHLGGTARGGWFVRQPLAHQRCTLRAAKQQDGSDPHSKCSHHRLPSVAGFSSSPMIVR